MLTKFGVGALAGMAAFQIALASGAPLGHLAWGGQSRTLATPQRVASAIAVLVYLVLALLLARRVGLITTATVPTISRRGALIVAAVFATGVPLNLASRSAPERWHAITAGVIAAAWFASRN